VQTAAMGQIPRSTQRILVGSEDCQSICDIFRIGW